jgi:glycosyltransferase involved in cell wall biosynthesis
MRIVVLGPRPPLRGGIAAHTEGVIDALRMRGHEVLSISYARLYPRWIAGERPGSGSTPTTTGDDIVIDCFRPRSWQRAAVKARHFAPDVFIAQYWTPLAAGAIGMMLARVASARRILVCHNVLPHEPIPGAASVVRWLWRRCDGVIFHSRYVRARAQALGCARPSAVARLPLLIGGGGEDAVAPPELEEAGARGARVFVCPGHVRRYKGLGVLAAAWRRAAMGGDAVLVVAGESLGARRDLRALRRLDSQVVIVPRYLADGELAWLLSRAEAVLLPYVSASQSGLLPVALRTARCVVYSDAGGLAEEPPAVGGGAAAAMVAAGDVDGLTTLLRELDRRSARNGTSCSDGALRHAVAPVSELERRQSWDSFLGALEELLAPSAAARASNSPGFDSSESCVENPGREPSARAWYDARRAE